MEIVVDPFIKLMNVRRDLIGLIETAEKRRENQNDLLDVLEKIASLSLCHQYVALRRQVALLLFRVAYCLSPGEETVVRITCQAVRLIGGVSETIEVLPQLRSYRSSEPHQQIVTKLRAL